MKQAIILLSGGVDSSTTLAVAREMGFVVSALTISYGQRNASELDAARKIAAYFHVADHKFLSIDLRQFGGSSLTDSIDVKNHDQQPDTVIPNTYVPARNTILLSLAMAFAEVRGACAIFYGANVHDYSGYPDCRPAYIEAFESMANLATKSAMEGLRLRIYAPLVNLSKAEIIARGHGLNVPYELTLSCYNPSEDLACGQCSACHYRKKGFSEAFLPDPTRYVALNDSVAPFGC